MKRNSKPDYSQMKINQLRRLAKEVNRINGEILNRYVIEQLFGKFVFYWHLTKAELITLLEELDNLRKCAPRSYNWSRTDHSPRISSVTADGRVWVTYIAMSSREEAERAMAHLAPISRWVQVRRGEFFPQCQWEIKVWRIDDAELARVSEKDRRIA